MVSRATQRRGAKKNDRRRGDGEVKKAEEKKRETGKQREDRLCAEERGV